MTRYLLNSAVLTAPGLYHYSLLSVEAAKAWLGQGAFLSAVGYEETARALQTLTGFGILVNRASIEMQPGDEALVFRLKLPPGKHRPGDGDKGGLGLEFIEQYSELGLLRCLQDEDDDSAPLPIWLELREDRNGERAAFGVFKTAGVEPTSGATEDGSRWRVYGPIDMNQKQFEGADGELLDDVEDRALEAIASAHGIDLDAPETWELD